MSKQSRTRHFRTLAGHLRLWAEGASSDEIMGRLRTIATQLEELADDIEAAHRPSARAVAEVESPAA